jgi:hypothetical protein
MLDHGAELVKIIIPRSLYVVLTILFLTKRGVPKIWGERSTPKLANF